MAITFMRSKGQVTIPREVREAAHLAEGDPVELEVTADGLILLRPKKLVDSSQAWFWTEDWQKRERQATDDIEAGRTEVFESAEDFVTSLE